MADTETEAGGSFIMNNRGHASHSAQVASEQERFISEETSTTEVMVRPKLLYPKYYKNFIGPLKILLFRVGLSYFHGKNTFIWSPIKPLTTHKIHEGVIIGFVFIA